MLMVFNFKERKMHNNEKNENIQNNNKKKYFLCISSIEQFLSIEYNNRWQDHWHWIFARFFSHATQKNLYWKIFVRTWCNIGDAIMWIYRLKKSFVRIKIWNEELLWLFYGFWLSLSTTMILMKINYCIEDERVS